jgi:hypothetical protein
VGFQPVDKSFFNGGPDAIHIIADDLHGANVGNCPAVFEADALQKSHSLLTIDFS